MVTDTGKASEPPLKTIVGEQLSAVVFVQDYVQLQFDGSVLTAITCPTVSVREIRSEWGMPGYRDMLCERIGKIVRAVSVAEEQEILIEFDDASVISISLKPEDYRAAEAAIFYNGPEEWVVW
jgi:hypothetical protein